MDWINNAGEWFDKVGELYGRVMVAKSAVWSLVSRHEELKQDALAVFAAVMSALKSRSLSGSIALIAAIENAVHDAQVAYTGEAAAVADLLAELKSILGA